jgi:hypothetical protein
MLASDDLRDNLLAFAAPDDARFEGYPTTRDRARRAWAHAFFDYFDAVTEDLVPPVPSNHPSFVTSAVEDAFYDSLQLTLSLSAADAAADFAQAWQAAVNAVMPTASGVTDSTLTLYVFVKFSNASTQKQTLETALRNIFIVPSILSKATLDAIATAFHAATVGLIATATVTPPASTPVGGAYNIK